MLIRKIMFISTSYYTMFTRIHFKSFSVILFTMFAVVHLGFSVPCFSKIPEWIATRMFCLEQIPVPVEPGTGELVVHSGDPESP